MGQYIPGLSQRTPAGWWDISSGIMLSMIDFDGRKEKVSYMLFWFKFAMFAWHLRGHNHMWTQFSGSVCFIMMCL